MKLGLIGSMTFLSILSGCSSAPVTGIDHAGEERVLSRIDGLGSRPSWLRESEPFTIDGGVVNSIGMTTIPADHRIEAAYRISDNNGKAAVATAIEQKLEFMFQNAEEGTSMDATQARYIGSEASKLTASSIRIGKHYWEKVSIVSQNGTPNVIYKVFNQINMPEQDFKAAIIDAIRSKQGKGHISEEFAKKVDQQWDSFTGQSTEKANTIAKQNNE